MRSPIILWPFWKINRRIVLVPGKPSKPRPQQGMQKALGAKLKTFTFKLRLSGHLSHQNNLKIALRIEYHFGVKNAIVGHFWVPPCLCLKTRVGAQSLIWKSFFILMQIKLVFTRKVVHLASFWKWGFLQPGSGLLFWCCPGVGRLHTFLSPKPWGFCLNARSYREAFAAFPKQNDNYPGGNEGHAWNWQSHYSESQTSSQRKLWQSDQKNRATCFATSLQNELKLKAMLHAFRSPQELVLLSIFYNKFPK